MGETKRLVKNTVIIAIGNLSTKVISFFLLPMYTSLLSTADYGVSDLFISLAAFLTPFITMLMEESLMRFLIDAGEDKKKQTSVISTALLICICGVSIFTMGATIILNIVNYEYTTLFVLFILANSITMIVNPILRGMGKTKTYAVYNFIMSATVIVLNVLFIAGFRWGLVGLLSSTIIAYIGCSLIMLIKIKIWKYFKISQISKNISKEMITYSIPLIPNKISWSIINFSSRMIIYGYMGESANGLYAISNKFPSLMDTFYGFFYMSWKESSARAVNTGEAKEFYNKIYGYLKNVLLSLVIFMIAAMPFAYKILINQKFYESIYCVPILIVAMYFANISGFYGGIFTAHKDTKIMGTTTMAAAAINIILNIVLIWKFGLYAAALSTLIANFVTAEYRRKKVKKYIELEENSNTYIGFIIVLIITIVLFYKENTIGWIINLLIGIVYAIVVNKNIIKVIQHQVKGIAKSYEKKL